jgi:sterol desaturase/sphingolipid hydroxylase (fatty acid hydroxylase superfamily)
MMRKSTTTANIQRTPSKWMVLAIAQALLFLFGLPPVSRMYWDSIFAPMTKEAGNIFLIVGTSQVGLILGNLVALPIYYVQHPFFEQFKIQKDLPWPWLDEREHIRSRFWKLITRSMKFTFVNTFMVLPAMTALKVYFLDDLMGTPIKESFFSTDDEHWPGTMKNITDLICLTTLHEFGFYAGHRLMHAKPFLYKYHKIHHEFKMNVTMAAQHNHTVDYFFSMATPALLATSVVNPHSFTLFQWTIWVIVANLDDHAGYEFPWSPVRWFPLSAASDEHEFHHSKNLGCFASKISIFNTLFGGYEAYDARHVVMVGKKSE